MKKLLLIYCILFCLGLQAMSQLQTFTQKVNSGYANILMDICSRDIISKGDTSFVIFDPAEIKFSKDMQSAGISYSLRSQSKYLFIDSIGEILKKNKILLIENSSPEIFINDILGVPTGQNSPRKLGNDMMYIDISLSNWHIFLAEFLLGQDTMLLPVQVDLFTCKKQVLEHLRYQVVYQFTMDGGFIRKESSTRLRQKVKLST